MPVFTPAHYSLHTWRGVVQAQHGSPIPLISTTVTSAQDPVSVCVCVCGVCERERERKKWRICIKICVCVYENVYQDMRVCV
jgi:hypothetical protein